VGHLPTVAGWVLLAHPDREPGTAEFPRITPHDLRHTAASLAVSAGANVKAVQKSPGHRRPLEMEYSSSSRLL
jgi:integrase